MNSAIFTLLNRLRAVPHLRPSPALFTPAATRHFSTKTSRSPPRPTLSSTIYPLGHPSIDLSLELDRWILSGNTIRLVELQNLIRDLRTRRRFSQALEVSEWMKVKWMKEKGGMSFMASDHAVHLDLMGEVDGLSAAKKYFECLKERDKNEKTYGALLNCYVRERLIDESLSHLQKMKEMGMASCPLPYNNIMSLYTNTGQHEKVPSVLEEMKNNMVLPDNFSYRICINSFGTRSDFEGMEKVLEEMEHQPQIIMDWNTYSVLANMYIKAGNKLKAVSALKKAEQKLEKKNGLCYNHLISLYGVLGNKQEMWRLWELQKVNCKKIINRDYTTMLGALVKLGELEEAEALLKEWELSGSTYDFRVPNVLLAAYRQRGLMEKAEEMIDEFLKKSKTPPSSSWGLVAAGYVEKGELGKAFEFMTNALCVYSPGGGWVPNPNVIRSILQYLGDEGEIKMVENFIGLLKNAVPVNRDVYHALIKCNIRAGSGVGKILEIMKAEGVEPNEETQVIISSFEGQNFASSS
ncbi:pentatricopeptide repeat-containing protein At4g21705, mitochondrial [Phalaenopsis equestris]|uniref:pentatricopeptide repeat-containing protein At4g21705, mitochondrial n=1 Tax=Phalaenopsis equestris TaxID=78828 RepID=UPI0009E42439|nr:pentatricopeptide repeat-containing protein At4g21705, mitochondrial [Phalaenopsis equestris]